MAILLPIAIGLGMYLLLIRPQQVKEKERKALVNSAKEGDKVVFGGGIYGTITEVADIAVYVEIADGIEVLAAKGNIQAVVPHFPGEEPEDDADDLEEIEAED